MKGLADGAGLKHGRQKLERLPPHLYLALGPGPGPRAPPAKLRAETPGRTDAAAAAGPARRARSCGACASSCNARAPPGVDRALNLSWTRMDSDGSAGCDGTVAPSSLRAALFLLKFPAASCPLRHSHPPPPIALPICFPALPRLTRTAPASCRATISACVRVARGAARSAGRRIRVLEARRDDTQG